MDNQGHIIKDSENVEEININSKNSNVEFKGIFRPANVYK